MESAALEFMMTSMAERFALWALDEEVTGFIIIRTNLGKELF